MSGSDGTIANSGAGGWSTLQLSGASVFTWSGGKMEGILVELGSPTSNNVTGTIDGDVWLNGSGLYNYGSFVWNSGGIWSDTGSACILNGTGGTFEVKSTRGLMASNAPERNVGAFDNLGLLKFNTPSVRLAADFTNSGGTVRVCPGTVELDYTAEQTNGSFELRGGTVRPYGGINHDRPLQIRDGSIIGYGTIDGNLTLGYEAEYGNEPTTTAEIAPGIADEFGNAIGTITIGHEFRMFGPADVMSIDVDAYGSYDQVIVNGVYAAPYGRLYVSVASSLTF